MEEGRRWEMTATFDGASSRLTFLARGEAKIGGEKSAFFIEMEQDGTLVQREGYIQDGEGIYRVAFGEDGTGRIEPPLPILRGPLQSGNTWTWKGVYRSADGDLPGEATCSLSGPEPVMTPAGRFTTYRVDQQITVMQPDGKYSTTTTQWFAPEVGLVKQSIYDGEERTTAELTKYHTAAKPDAGKEGSDDPAAESAH